MHVAVRRAGEFRSVRFPAWAPIQNEAYPPNVFMVLVVPISMGTAGRQIRAGPARWLRGPGRTALTTPDGLHGPPRAEIVQEAQIFAVTETTAHAVTARARSSTPPSGGARCARIRRLTRAQSARVELASRARRAAFEWPRGRRRRARIPARPGASRRSALAPRERPASARSTCAFCAGRQRRLHFDLLFARQLPAHVNRTMFFTRGDGRVVVQLPDNYPADSHSACKFI